MSRQTTSKISTIYCSNNSQNYSYKYGNDSLPTVELATPTSNNLSPVFYINGIQSNSSFLRTINPKSIDSIRVEKREGEYEIDNIKHSGKIYIKT